MNMNNKDSSRINEIFACLLEEYDLAKLMEKFPSVREIRTAFRCGQNTATTVLNMLAEHFHFKRTPRCKSRLSLDLSGSCGETVWSDFLYQKRQCTIVILQDSAFCWQPLIEEFNKEHHHPLKMRLICHIEECDGLIDSGEADLLLLPNHPATIGIAGGLSRFMDISGLANNLPLASLHQAAMIRDRENIIRGIAPALVPKLLISHKKLNALPQKQMDIFELPAELGKIKKANPLLQYAASFDSYLHFFCNCGLDIAGLLDGAETESRLCFRALELFRSLYKRQLIPANSDLLSWGYVSFFNRETAMVESFYSKIPRSFGNRYRFDLSPAAPDLPLPLISEALVICPGSVRYEQAWDFIKYVLSPSAQQMLLSRMNGIPVLKGLKPLSMPREIHDLFSPVLKNAVRRSYENLMTPARFRFFESGIDRLVKYGGDMNSFLEDFKLQCRGTE